MNQLALALSCKRSVCERPCCKAVCPYERDAFRERWYCDWRKRRIVGPLTWTQSSWATLQEGFNPWAKVYPDETLEDEPDDIPTLDLGANGE